MAATARKKRPTPKPSPVVQLTDDQRLALTKYYVRWQEVAARVRSARWFSRRRRERQARELYEYLNDLLAAIAGPGATLSFERGEVEVRKPQ